MNYMTTEQKDATFKARAEALAKIVEARRAKASAALDALTCAERLAAAGLTKTATGMLDDIASEADAVVEFYTEECRILREQAELAVAESYSGTISGTTLAALTDIVEASP
jgi:hypothetical protein